MGDARFVMEGAVAHVVLPVALVLRLPHCGKRAQQRVIGDSLGPSLVQASVLMGFAILVYARALRLRSREL